MMTLFSGSTKESDRNLWQLRRPDAFRLWSANYHAFGQSAMAERIGGLEEAFYALMADRVPFRHP
jgi:hypothetical protein